MIKRELAKIIYENLDLPRSLFITVSNVKVSKDVAHAKVSLSIYPFKEAEKVINLLNKDIYNFQQILNKKLFLKPVPKISFQIDKSQEMADKIDKAIKK